MVCLAFESVPSGSLLCPLIYSSRWMMMLHLLLANLNVTPDSDAALQHLPRVRPTGWQDPQNAQFLPVLSISSFQEIFLKKIGPPAPDHVLLLKQKYVSRGFVFLEAQVFASKSSGLRTRAYVPGLTYF